MKTLKKLKKKLSKKLEHLKECLSAQAFYLQSMASNLSRFILKCIKYGTLAMLMGIMSFGSSIIHSTFIEHKIGSNTVYIRSAKDASLQGSATGFEVKAPSGKVYTLTNAHVCGLADAQGIVMVEEKRFSGRLIPKHVIEVYDENDLCLVEGLQGYEGLTLASGSDVGDLVWSVGYPLGEGMNISSGRIKAYGPVKIVDTDIPAEQCTGKHMHMEKFNTLFGTLEFCAIEREAAQTDVATYPGNSGSPLVNVYGNVEGIMFASNSDTNWGSAVDVSVIKTFLKAY